MKLVYEVMSGGNVVDIIAERIRNNTIHSLKDFKAGTPLLKACKDGERESLAIIKELVKQGADVNEARENGYTPLLISLFNKDMKVANFLLDNGANPNKAEEKIGCSPLMMACERLENDLDTIKKLIECGADIDQRDKTRRTALMIACVHQKSSDVISYLIEKGADVNAEENMEWTPLKFACFHGGKHKVLALLKAGANVNHTDHLGQNAFSVSHGRDDIRKMLCDHIRKQPKKNDKK